MRWIRTHGWLVAIACAYLYIFPYFPKIHSANELPRIYLVKAMTHDRTFAIDRGVATWGTTADVSPFAGHVYSNKAPGSSLLAVPVYAAASAIAGEPSLGESLWIARVVTGVLPTVLFCWLLFGFLVRFAPEPSVRRLVVIAYALGSMAMTYSLLYYSHQLAAVCVGCAWVLIVEVGEGKRGIAWAVIAGLCAGAAPLVDYQALFAAVPIGVQLVVVLARRRVGWGRGCAIVGGALGGALVPIAVLLAYHAACFGSPWKTGYDASTTFAVFHQQGFLGMTEVKWERFVGSMVAPDNGLLTLAPWLVLVVPGFVLVVRAAVKRRASKVVVMVVDVVVPDGDTTFEGGAATAVRKVDAAPVDGGLAHGITCAAIVVIYVLFVSSLTFWRGGWGVGPRYITVMLPFALPPIAVVLQRAWASPRRAVWIGALAGTIVAGVCVYALSSATFPYWPDSVKNPMVDVTVRLLRDNLVAPNVGGALGVGGVLGIAPYLLAVAGVLGWAIWRAAGAWWSVAIAAGVGLALVGGFYAFPHGHPEHAYQYVRGAVVGT